VLSSPVRRGSPLVAFGVGLVAGGLLTATGLLVVGALVRAPLPVPLRWTVVGLATAGVLVRELGTVRIPLPENRRLVPDSVLRLGRHLGPFQFGLEMGTGMRTYLPSGLPYAAAVAVALAAPPSGALLAGAAFGLGRMLTTVSNLRYSDDHQWDDAWRRYARPVSAAMWLVFALSLAAAAAG
jgi:hypothetical protein